MAGGSNYLFETVKIMPFSVFFFFFLSVHIMSNKMHDGIYGTLMLRINISTLVGGEVKEEKTNAFLSGLELLTFPEFST